MTPATSTPHFTPLINWATYGVEDRSCVWLLLCELYPVFNLQISFSYLLDVNTEVEILKATVVKVIYNKPIHSPKSETHTLYR